MNFFVKSTKKVIILTEEDEKLHSEKQHLSNLWKKFNFYKVGGHCEITGKHRGPAHQQYNVVSQKQSNFIQSSFIIS